MRFINQTKLDEALSNNHFSEVLPFPHVIIDDFFNESALSELLTKYPTVDDKTWWVYNNPLEKKFAFNDLAKLDSDFQVFFDELNSHEFLSFLSALSAVPGLLADPSLYGGGLHQILRGGKLDVHEDFNIHPVMNVARRLNLITYLNKNWHFDYGGDLQLWNKEMTSCEESALPIFNRVVIFRTDMHSNHGHPIPLTCPEAMSRKSLATYYYTELSSDEQLEYTSTIYKKLPFESDDPELDQLRDRRKKGRIQT